MQRDVEIGGDLRAASSARDQVDRDGFPTAKVATERSASGECKRTASSGWDCQSERWTGSMRGRAPLL